MNQHYDVIIVGAGTAGLSAAIYTQRAGKKALVLEGSAYGGQIINTLDVENYPGIKHVSGFDFATGLYEQATELGATVEFEQVLEVQPIADTAGSVEGLSGSDGQENIDGSDNSVDPKEKFLVRTSVHEYYGKAIILATGVVRRKLGLSQEAALTGKGVSYCATCDGAFYRGKDVAVDGGGNTALEDAVYLAGVCNKVYLIHRRDQFRADASEVAKIRGKENIELVLNSTIDTLNAGSNGKLESVETVDKTDGSRRTLSVSGLFIAIGQVPSNKEFAGLVELDPAGYIAAGEDCRTSAEGVFAAGDCRTKKVRQLTTAAADGAVAALAACGYIDAQG